MSEEMRWLLVRQEKIPQLLEMKEKRQVDVRNMAADLQKLALDADKDKAELTAEFQANKLRIQILRDTGDRAEL